jgi:drug/metabolite transporter (DMT)-like permease
VIWRTALAALGFAWVAKQAGRSLHLPTREKRWMVGVGGLLGLHWILFFLSARMATASVSLAAMPTAMLWCSLVEPWIDGSRRWRPVELLIGCIMVGAVWMIYEVELRYWQGFSVALISAFLAAMFAVVNKQLVARCHYAVMGTYQMSGALLAGLLGWLLLTPGQITVPGMADGIWLIVLASICTVWAYGGYMDVLQRMSVFTINVIYNLEPVYGILLAAVIFGSQEFMSRGFYVGAGIITGSVFLVPWLTRRSKSHTNEPGIQG